MQTRGAFLICMGMWEWTNDWKANYSGNNITDPKGPDTGSEKIVRGGSYISLSLYARSARRHAYEANATYSGIGFRLAFKPIQNSAPFDLNSTAPFTVAENQPIDTIVGEFNATDPDGDALTYHLASGEGDAGNSKVTIDANGVLKTAQILDHESAPLNSIRVQVVDELNASMVGIFTVSVTDVNEPPRVGSTVELSVVESEDAQIFSSSWDRTLGEAGRRESQIVSSPQMVVT